MSFAQRLHELRIRRGMSLQDVAERVGISKAHVWNLEKGISENPSMELVVKLAELFRVRVADLVGRTPSREEEPAEMVALFRDLKRLDERDRETIRVLMDQLRKTKEKRRLKISRLELDGAGSPLALVTRILEIEPDLPIPVPIRSCADGWTSSISASIETSGFEAALVTDRCKASGAILVAKDRSRRRRRFSIAHELGHFLIPTHLPPSESGFLCSSEDLRLQTTREQDRHARMEAQANQLLRCC